MTFASKLRYNNSDLKFNRQCLARLTAIVLSMFGLGTTAARQCDPGELFFDISFDTGDAPFSVAIGDLDGDGILDLALPNAGSGDISVLLGN